MVLFLETGPYNCWRASHEHWRNHQIIVQSDRGTSTMSSTAPSGEQQFPYMVSATPQWYEVFHYKDTKMKREREWESVTGRRFTLHYKRRLCTHKNSNGHKIVVYIHNSLLFLCSRVSTSLYKWHPKKWQDGSLSLHCCVTTYKERTKWLALNAAFKELVHPQIKILSLTTHPHVAPNPQDLLSSSEHKLRCFSWNRRAVCHSIGWNVPKSRNVGNTSVKQSMWHQWLNLRC